MSNCVSLADILGNRRIGGLRVGSRAEDVARLLGEPEGVSGSRGSVIWKYWDLQVFIEDASVHMLGLYPRGEGAIRLPSPLAWEGWSPGREISLDEFAEWLRGSGIDFEVDDAEEDYGQIEVVVGGCRTYFVNGTINSILLR